MTSPVRRDAHVEVEEVFRLARNKGSAPLFT
jgi:hypothetical protein